MHTKKVSFNSFFTSFQYFDIFELLKILGGTLTAKPPDIDLLTELSKSCEDYLKHTNSFVLITDLRCLRFLYISQSVEQVTGFTPKEFMNGGVTWLIKNYCPADRENGMKALHEVIDHQKQPDLEDKDSYQYTSTFRMLNKRGFYTWLCSKRMYVAHDNKNFPWIEVSVISLLRVFKQNDNMNLGILKFNKKAGVYETEHKVEHEPAYLNILNETDLKILKLLAEGFDNKQIAEKLSYSEHTIKDYRKKMLKKTWCDNTAELLTFALRNKLIN